MIHHHDIGQAPLAAATALLAAARRRCLRRQLLMLARVWARLRLAQKDN